MTMLHIAAFRVAGGRLTVSELTQDTVPLRCASLLKPLLFWSAARRPPFVHVPASWAEMAEPAVRVSANDPTVAVWQQLGADRILADLAQWSPGRWEIDPGGRRSFGRVLIDGRKTAELYGALTMAALDGDRPATRLLDWMTQTPEEMTFGVRGKAAQALGVDPGAVAVKTGWFSDTDETCIRTHAVTVTRLGDEHAIGTVTLTAAPLEEHRRAAYARTYKHGPEVLPFHESVAAKKLGAATVAALGAVCQSQPAS